MSIQLKDIELLPCPFCGKDAKINEDMDAITCVDSEGGCGFYYNIELDVADTIKQWNTRAGQKRIEKVWDRKVLLNTITKVLKPSCTCNDGNGIVCVGCFYKNDIVSAIISADQKEEIVKLRAVE